MGDMVAEKSEVCKWYLFIVLYVVVVVVQPQKLKSHFWFSLFPERSKILSEKKPKRTKTTTENLAKKKVWIWRLGTIAFLTVWLLPRGGTVYFSSGAVWICPICWGSATPWSCFKMEPWGWWEGCSSEGFFLPPHWFAIRAAVSFILLFSSVHCYKKKLLNPILFMKSGAGLPANQWFQWCFYFI